MYLEKYDDNGPTNNCDYSHFDPPPEGLFSFAAGRTERVDRCASTVPSTRLFAVFMEMNSSQNCAVDRLGAKLRVVVLLFAK